MIESLLVMVPTRWRKENCERLLKSFTAATDFADIVFIMDKDDEDTYADMDWGTAATAVLDYDGKATGSVKKQNYVAMMQADNYDAMMYIGDDHLFSTPHWDTIMAGRLNDKGGTGMIYGDDKRRHDIPEMIIITSDIVKALGHFAEPSLDHYFIDNCWGELGFRSGLITYCPDVVFEHLHYQMQVFEQQGPQPVNGTERDQTYSYAESQWGASDRAKWQEWRGTRMPSQVSVLRRNFNPDVQWLMNAF
jgi:hypothetical protein